MEVVAFAGGVGAGKFLRGLVRAVPPDGVTVVGNVADDLRVHGLHVSPDLDSVAYWLAGEMDRERGWGRRDESFRVMDTLRGLDPDAAWFSLGDRDLATHLLRTRLLDEGRTLSEATAAVAGAIGSPTRLLPATDDPLTTFVDVVADGRELELHFQEYWVGRGARDEVKRIRFEGASTARPAPGVLEAIEGADAIVLCPSNPVVSIGPILSVPGIRRSLADRRGVVGGVSPIVDGAPLAGMADRLMPAMGLEVSALGAARAYEGLLGSWVIDERDRDLAGPIRRALGVRVAVTDTVMTDDGVAEALARTLLRLVTT